MYDLLIKKNCCTKCVADGISRQTALIRTQDGILLSDKYRLSLSVCL